MRPRLGRKLRPTIARLRRPAAVIAVLALIAGTGMMLYQVHAAQTLSAQGVEPDKPITIASELKGNSSKTLGPITASEGSWLDLRVVSNKSISLHVSSNLTGTIYNSTGRIFAQLVPLHNSTEYRVEVINPGASRALLKGNATLTILSFTTVSVLKTTHPWLWAGVAFVSVGAVMLFYVALPKEPARKHSIELLFN